MVSLFGPGDSKLSICFLRDLEEFITLYTFARSLKEMRRYLLDNGQIVLQLIRRTPEMDETCQRDGQPPSAGAESEHG
jgi:hypothetical protein